MENTTQSGIQDGSAHYRYTSCCNSEDTVTSRRPPNLTFGLILRINQYSYKSIIIGLTSVSPCLRWVGRFPHNCASRGTNILHWVGLGCRSSWYKSSFTKEFLGPSFGGVSMSKRLHIRHLNDLNKIADSFTYLECSDGFLDHLRVLGVISGLLGLRCGRLLLWCRRLRCRWHCRRWSYCCIRHSSSWLVKSSKTKISQNTHF